MASRNLVDQRRKAMEDALRQACRQGTLSPGEPLPALRTLAEQYGLSRQIAWKAIQNLTAEGLLTTSPRTGTFVSRPKQDVRLFLLTTPHDPSGTFYLHQIQTGFEERISQLGGTTLLMVEAEAARLHAEGQLPPLSGIFHSGYNSTGDSRLRLLQDLPTVAFGQTPEEIGNADKIVFDDEGGGRLATQHLLAMGHTRVAYLALHTVARHPREFFWSIKRETGWSAAMAAAGLTHSDLAFYPTPTSSCDMQSTLTGHQQFQVAYEVTRDRILPRGEITAVLAANVTAAEGFLAALRESGLSYQDWPAVLCFDNSTPRSVGVFSYMRLPWDELGRQAANLLWSRTSGVYAGPPRTSLVPMNLIQRLSCRPRNLDDRTGQLLFSGVGAY